MSDHALDVDGMVDVAVQQMASALVDDDADRALRWARIAGALLEVVGDRSTA